MNCGQPENAGGVGNIVARISSVYSGMTKSEQKVAAAVLKKPAGVIYETVSDVAANAGVGEATVLRFCRKMGLSGFYAFKLAVAQEQASAGQLPGTIDDMRAEGAEGIRQLARRTMEQSMASLEETFRLLDPASVDKAVDILIHMGGTAHFFGLGMSNNTAVNAMVKFMRIGVRSSAVIDAHTQLMAASLLTPDDVAVAISLSGSTKDTVDIMRTAKQAGAKTVCITHHLRSPISAYADVILLMGSREGLYQDGSTTLSQEFVINVLFNCVCVRCPQLVGRAREKVSAAIANRLY